MTTWKRSKIRVAKTTEMVDVIRSFQYKTAGRGKGVLGLKDLAPSRRPGENKTTTVKQTTASDDAEKRPTTTGGEGGAAKQLSGEYIRYAAVPSFCSIQYSPASNETILCVCARDEAAFFCPLYQQQWWCSIITPPAQDLLEGFPN